MPGKFPARAVPTDNLEMGGAEERRGNKGTELRLPAGMAAHQRAREIYKMSNKVPLKASGLLILLLQEKACDVDTRKTRPRVGNMGFVLWKRR